MEACPTAAKMLTVIFFDGEVAVKFMRTFGVLTFHAVGGHVDKLESLSLIGKLKTHIWDFCFVNIGLH